MARSRCASQPAAPGERVVDIGCGFGDTAQRIAGMVGPGGEVLGVDASPRFIETSRQEAGGRRRGQRQLRGGRSRGGARGRVRHGVLAHGHDVLRQPGDRAAQHPRRAAARAGGCAWWCGGRRSRTRGCIAPRRWSSASFRRTRTSDEPTCGPGPFSMANADTVTGQLVTAGFDGHRAAALRSADAARRHRRRAVGLAMAIGPAGRGGPPGGRRRRGAAAPDRGVAARTDRPSSTTPTAPPVAPTSTWIVTATAP